MKTKTYPFLRIAFVLGLALLSLAPAIIPAIVEADEPTPVPHGPTPEDLLYIEQLIQQRAMRTDVGILAAPSGTVWTPGEYEALYGPLVAWEPGSYLSLLTEFIVGVTTDPNMDSLAFVIVSGSSQEASCTSTLQSAGADMDRVKFIHYNLNTVWIRDYGPRYISEDGSPAIIDFTYNRNRPSDDGLPAFLSTYDIPFDNDEPVYEMDLTHGGGNFHAVSTGDAFMSTLIVNENTDKTQSQIETIIEDHHNVNVTIYDRLPSSIDSTGHIDMWLLPLSDTDILVSEFSSGTGKTITDAAADDLETRGYTVWRTPAWTSGGTHYTYANAAIVNKRVFIPQFSSYSTQNAQALAVYQAALPDHTIIPVDSDSIIGAGGAVHCVMKHVYVPATPFGEVLVPNGGQSWDEGEQHEIKWIANDDVEITSVDIYYSTDGGATYPHEIATGETHDGYYTWTVPNTPSTQCRIKIVVHDGDTNSYEDISDADFTITGYDDDPPTPDPMTWATLPTATAATRIAMTATTASDPSGVEYYFECLTVGGHHSGWQDSPSYEDTGLEPDTEYTYRVKARDKSDNQNETQWSTEESATTEPPPPPPAAPTNLTATAASQSQINLTWADNADNEAGFEIERSTDGGWTFSALTSVGADVTAHSDTGLPSCTQYCYRVRATNAGGVSDWSNVDCATTQPPPVASDVELLGSWTTGDSHAAPAGSDRALIFTAGIQDNDSGGRYVTAVSYGGQSMTQVEEADYATGSYHYYVTAWILGESGIQNASDSNFLVTWGGTDQDNAPGYSSVFLQNVNQSSLFGAHDDADCDCNTLSTDALSTNDGDMVMLAAFHGGNSASSTDYVVQNGFTEDIEFYDPPNSGECVTGHKAATGADETPQVYNNGNDYASRQSLVGFVVQASEVENPTDPTEITAQPEDQSKFVGEQATFSVTATGTNLSYQWQVNTGSGWSDIGGETNSSYTIDPVTLGHDGNYYRCVVTGDCGTAYSFAALLTVEPGNQPPVVSDIADQTINEGQSFTTINLDDHVDDPDNSDAEISWTYAGNSELTVSIDASRVATIGIPDPDWNGSETITFTATDPGLLSDSDDATFTVNAVNDAPSFTKGADQTVDQDCAAQTVPGWATGMSPGPANESSQALDFIVTNDNNPLFSVQPAVNATSGDLTYTPAPGENGSAVVTVRLHDNGGTDYGGQDTSAPQTFNITVRAKHSIALQLGWNLVSFRLQPQDTSIAAVLSSIDGNYDLVYAWDAVAQAWLLYDPDTPPGDLTELDEKKGFWIHMTAANTLVVTGSVPTTTDINLYSTGAGWNLVGYPSAVNRDLPAVLEDHGVGTDFSLVYAYHANDTTDPWKLWDRTAWDDGFTQDLTHLSSDWGYWVKVSVSHPWDVDYPAP